MTAFVRRLQELLDDLIVTHSVVGAGAAVLVDGEVVEVASGYANRRHGVPMMPQTLCLAGSTTKVFTATLIMQLVDDGLLRLDTPVRRYLPDTRVPEEITTEQLLSHTSGLDVGAYADYGRNSLTYL